MKSFTEILNEQTNTKTQTFKTVLKNIDDEIIAYKSAKSDIEKQYLSVLKDLKIVINKRSKLHKKEDTMTNDELVKTIKSLKSFKIYDKDKMTDETDFSHMMDN
jgi:hypothetical protein